MKLRLDKYLSDMSVGTRSEVKRMIAGGQVSVCGLVVKKPEIKIDTDRDVVMCRNQKVSYIEYEYYMLNKPQGVISATEDKNERTVLDLIDSGRKDLFPAGRLDKDTEGLLLITNDGPMSHRLLSPKKHVDKVYYARIEGRITTDDVRLFSEGLDIGESRKTLSAKLRILKADNESEVEVTIQEGKFHQVKRMFHAVGKEVLYLKRIQMGPLKLDDTLLPGAYRKLTEKEIELLEYTR